MDNTDSSNISGAGTVKRDAWGEDDARLRRSFRSSWEQELEALELLTLKAEKELLHKDDASGPTAWQQCHSRSPPGASLPIDMAAVGSADSAYSLPHSATSVDDHSEFPTIAHAEEMLARSLEEKAAAAAPAVATATTPDSSSGTGGARSRSSSSGEKSKGKARAWSAASYDAYGWSNGYEDELLEDYDPCQFELEGDVGGVSTAAEAEAAVGHYEAVEDTGAAATSGNPVDNSLLTCAICLDSISPAELTLVKGCEHAYCCSCILRWADTQINGKGKNGECCVATCPTCKKPFEYVYIARNLDGTFNDSLAEESITLLLRATWLDKQRDEQIKLSGNGDYYDEDFCDEDFMEDDDLFLLNSHTRGKLLGNRRFGPNGFMKSGRMQARAPSSSPSTSSNGKCKGKGKVHMTPNKDAATASTPPTSNSTGKKGRRARRKEMKEKEEVAAY